MRTKGTEYDVVKNAFFKLLDTCQENKIPLNYVCYAVTIMAGVTFYRIMGEESFQQLQKEALETSRLRAS